MIWDMPPKIWTPPAPAIIRPVKAREANFLPGMHPGFIGAAPEAAPPFSIVWTDNSNDNNNVSVHTHSSMDIGTAPGAGETRYIVAAIGHWGTSTVSSVTIGGVSASLVVAAEDLNGDDANIALYIAEVPTGTTADVVITLSAAFVVTTVGLWAMYNPSSTTPDDTASDTVDSSGLLDLSVNTVSGGGVIAAGMFLNASTTTWTGVTEDYDADSFTNEFYTGGSASDVVAATPRTITAQCADTTPESNAFVAASWH